MAKDDYHVIVYQILAYLYRCLKEGEDIDEKMLKPGSKLLKIDINERYFNYIICNIVNKGFVDGVMITKAFGGDLIDINLEDAMITPEGIEYLCDNKFIKKAYDYARDVLTVLPIKL